jgi:hypothetical protein
MIDVERTIVNATREILAMARNALLKEGSFIPTAVLHTVDGLVPVIMPFDNLNEKKRLVEIVKKRVLELDAYAVSTITCARVVDSRTGEEDETLVLTSVIQSGAPYVAIQPVIRDRDRTVLCFGEIEEGDAAGMPGQMTIYPDWPNQYRH